MEIVGDPVYKTIYPDFYAADAHVVRLIYEMIMGLLRRITIAEGDIIRIQDNLVYIHRRINEFSPTKDELKWIGVMGNLVIFIQPELPTTAQCDPWAAGSREISVTGSKVITYRMLWIDSNRVGPNPKDTTITGGGF